MKIIHIGQQAKQADYAGTGEIVQEIAQTLARNEGTTQVLQIYTYPEEAFLKRGTHFFSQGEVDTLCRDLRSLMGEYPYAVLCLGILRSETIAGKLFLINSALVFYRQDYAAFDKQVVSDVDTVWRHCTAPQTISENFIGDYIDNPWRACPRKLLTYLLCPFVPRRGSGNSRDSPYVLADVHQNRLFLFSGADADQRIDVSDVGHSRRLEMEKLYADPHT